MTADSTESQDTLTRELPLVEGSLWQAIWVMSWPLLLTMVAGSIVGIVDVQVAGYLGPAAQAAVGVAEQVLFLFMVFIMSVSVGTTAIVSREFGAGQFAQADHATAQSLSLSVILGLSLCSLAFATAHLILPFFTSSKEVLAQGTLYLSIFALQLIPFSIVSIVNAAFRAIGDARTPLSVTLASVAVTIAGDYLTVVAQWPVPGLGIRGLAISAIAGSTVGTVFALGRLARSPIKKSMSCLFPLSLECMKRVADIGLPSAFHRLSWAGSVFALFFILSRCQSPTEALASWTIGMRTEGLLFMPLMAFSLAVSSIVGQNLGAHRVDRAFRAGWHVTWIGVFLMSALGLLMFFLAGPLAHFMSHDAKTSEYAASYLRINAVAEPFLAVAMILGGALQGAGDSRTPMWVSIFSNWVVRLPLAWLFALKFNMGPPGVWTAMVASVTLMGCLLAWRFQSGSWVKTKV